VAVTWYGNDDEVMCILSDEYLVAKQQDCAES
jgi:hypothetical protein